MFTYFRPVSFECALAAILLWNLTPVCWNQTTVMWVITASRCVLNSLSFFRTVGEFLCLQGPSHHHFFHCASAGLAINSAEPPERAHVSRVRPNAGQQSFGNSRREALLGLFRSPLWHYSHINASNRSLRSRGRIWVSFHLFGGLFHSHVSRVQWSVYESGNWAILRPLYIVTWPNLADKLRPPTVAPTAWKDTFLAREVRWKSCQMNQRMIGNAERMCILDLIPVGLNKWRYLGYFYIWR